ncbi:hypothetical protein MHLP_01135 [Candidatus Mycoplasma haematolamae str. Purdue]|uniref:Uncharacterized protein n=1 Tax=Mycoplasma haematolamae (strain Purdue) TaxID=1212765 RepID=I7C5M0_MYCHA|nr:hypothetical protein [Candidatus Mycoplasma haematolamae]AFO51807.1 hypothetical protein MHLP_01135 [Candidatus Mycoplasma haematolamae str. Purdue]
MFNKVVLGIAGLGTTAGIGTAVALPIFNSVSDSLNTFPAKPSEEKDLDLWEKGANFEMKLTKGSVSSGAYLKCDKKQGYYTYFRFQDQEGQRVLNLICDYVEEKKDIKVTEDNFGTYSVKVACNQPSDVGDLKKYECTVTTTKQEMQLKIYGDQAKLALYW